MSLLSKDRFAGVLVERLRTEYPDTRIKASLPFGVVLASTSWGEIRVFFDKPYALYVQSPQRLEAILRKALQDLDPTGRQGRTALESCREYLLPALKGAEYLDAVRNQLEGLPHEATPAIRDLTPSVLVAYVIDRPDATTRTVVTRGDLRTWNLAPEDLHQIALENLRRVGNLRITQASTESIGVLFAVEPADSYNASRILLGIAAEVARTASDDLCIAIPAPELFLLVPWSNQKGTEWLRCSVIPQKFKASPARITSRILVFRRGTGMLEEAP